ncbi:MAG: hypothetical protein JSV88_00755 [Candidatus Aminicenantes bacterium]|nr:MAG: hypothetical protein JSV88_00755 [Candidatus Aminicenantes bacterium]
MGSFKPYPKGNEEQLISRMINSIFYFYKFVFILKEGNHYRLVAIQEKRKTIDISYNTLKGAKIACSRILRNGTNNKGLKPIWSFLYPPDEKWLRDKLNRKNDTTAPLQPTRSRRRPEDPAGAAC